MRPLKAIHYWRAGLDTEQIAAVLRCSEAEAYNQLHAQREAEISCRPYVRTPKPLSRRAMWHFRDGELVFGPVPANEMAVAS